MSQRAARSLPVTQGMGAVKFSMGLLPTKGPCGKFLDGSVAEEMSEAEATKSSVHSGADTREATDVTHLAGLLPVPWVPRPRHKKITGDAILCTVEQTQERPQASLILLAGCQSLGCPAPGTRKSHVTRFCAEQRPLILLAGCHSLGCLALGTRKNQW